MIVEMAGRPAEHLTESLEKHVNILRKVKDIKVEKIEVSEARIIERKDNEKAEDMFTAFAECEFEIPSFSRLAETMFDFMPSSVEVIEPSSVELDTFEATGLLNNISGRLHRYDDIAKIAGEKIRLMDEQLKIAKKILNDKDKRIAELEKGIKTSKKVKKKTVKKKISKKVNKK